MDEQVGVAAGSWQQPGDGGSLHTIAVRVHAIANPQAASHWIDHATQTNIRTDGWTITGYKLGDGGYAATYQDGKRYEVNFRKGRFLAFVSGESKTDVERFARFLLAAMAETE